MDTVVSVLIEVTAALEEAGIEYVVVGSLASSMHGMYRATADIDLVADLKTSQINALMRLVKDRFYIDENVAREAVERKRSFNLIHFDSVFKVDIFIPKPDEFAWQQLLHRQLRPIDETAEVSAYVSTAEDTIVAKLFRYRAGQESSNVQWRDIIGILTSRNQDLEYEYMRLWASRFDVTDLLERAITESH